MTHYNILSIDVVVKILRKYLQSWQKLNGQTSKFARKLHFLGIRKVLNLGLNNNTKKDGGGLAELVW